MENFEYEIAEKFVNHTATHIFLTGKAGTGKTTFLRDVIKNSSKKSVVVAPTGVAAINAGGVTIHSMFGLPTKSFIPSNDPVDPNLANNQEMISRHFHYHKDKLEVLQELELLVIDEVSMVRGDILDAVDFSLRYVRRNSQPFGGVQVLFIGDMYQLPPVIKDEEWPLLSRYYSSPYFFDSLAFRELDPVYIELRKIYRQTDNYFIRILNNIRNQDFQEDDYEALKQHYQPEFEPDEPGYITLTTHNRKADAINEKELLKLQGDNLMLDAEVSGDFSESMFPTERLLRLKIGAQVMFVKNDTSGERKYFNGKIGLVEDMHEDDGLGIRFPDTGEKIRVKQEIWENVRYSMNAEENRLKQNRIGSFKQYPLRLAWAITIHKSQGLTFEKAVIDAGESFAPGQVYVALSRCTSMDNLVLKSIITGRNIFSDPRIVDFSHRIMKDIVLENRLEEAKRKYEFDKLQTTFYFDKLVNQLQKWEKSVFKLKSLEHSKVLERSRTSRNLLEQMQQVALKFNQQINSIFAMNIAEEQKRDMLVDRLQKAVVYFSKELYRNIIVDWETHFEENRFKSKLKRYVRSVEELLAVFWNKLESMQACTFDGTPVAGLDKIERHAEAKISPVKKAKTKGGTYDDTLDLYRQGKSIAEIAAIRDMAVSTIEGHIGKWIAKGEIPLEGLVSNARVEAVRAAIEEIGSNSLGALRSHLGDDYSFSEIRWILQAPKAAAVS